MVALPGAALLTISNDAYASVGAVLLTFVGTTAGFIASLFKKSTTYTFTGDIAKWKVRIVVMLHSARHGIYQYHI